jgi:hypothetical protein
MKKIWKKNIFITGALLSFFFLGGLSTARAECDPTSLTVSNATTEHANGVYLNIGVGVWMKNGNIVIYDSGSGYSIDENPIYMGRVHLLKVGDIHNPIGNYQQYPDFDPDTATVSQTSCEPEPEPEPQLVGGYFFKTPPASSLGAGVGSISTDVMGGLLPYIYIVGGLLVGFWLVEKILALIPKDNTMEKADKEIARSERLIKEEKRIIATLN